MLSVISCICSRTITTTTLSWKNCVWPSWRFEYRMETKLLQGVSQQWFQLYFLVMYLFIQLPNGIFIEKKRDFLQVDPCNPCSPNLPVLAPWAWPHSPQSQPFSPEGTQLKLTTDLRVFSYILFSCSSPHSSYSISPVTPFPCLQKLLMSQTPASATSPNFSSISTSFLSHGFVFGMMETSATTHIFTNPE